MDHVRHKNPFFNRQRIVEPAYFRGRAQEVEALYSAIATRQCRSVVGERKLGKSSLLTHLSRPDTLRRHGFDPHKIAFVYADLEGMANISYEELWPEWLDQLSMALPEIQRELRGLCLELAAQPRVRFMQVRRALRRIDRAGITVVFMLDEFESLAANGSFEPAFYGELRSLAGEMGVVYITASKRSLFDLTYDNADTLSSPFFNIFSEELLGLMPLSEAAMLLRDLSSLSGTGTFTPEQIEYLIDLAGPHPFFLQLAGHYLYAARQQEPSLSHVPEPVVRRLMMEAEDHYRYMWEQLSAREQALLGRLENGALDEEALRRLREKALVRQGAGGKWEPFSRGFADFLARVDPLQVSFASNPWQDTGALTGVTLGRYRVLTPVGRGGMAIVYKGYQPTLDRYVAVKVLSHRVAQDRTFLERFQREAAAVARLRHQNLVQMLDFGVHKDLSYMVMEYIDGHTLKERLVRLRDSEQRLSLKEAAQIVRDVAAALDYAHAHGIIHRDVKPANIMLRPEEKLAQLTGAVPFTAVLTDFGVARMLESVQLTGTGATIGTPDYMSPEQAQGEAATPASDIYALGIVIYEMLTGELPFAADSPLAVLLKHLQARPPLLESKVPDLPTSLELVIMRALAKSPEERFATAGDLARAFTEAVEPIL